MEEKNSRSDIRNLLAKSFGNKCCICGYSGCITAFDYHHINHKNKKYSISKGFRNRWCWSKIIKEAKKCVLICCRCHRELHAGKISLPKKYPRFNKRYSKIKLPTRV